MSYAAGNRQPAWLLPLRLYASGTGGRQPMLDVIEDVLPG